MNNRYLSVPTKERDNRKIPEILGIKVIFIVDRE